MSQVEFEAHIARQPKATRLSHGLWCGPRGLRLLNLVYALAFSCLLRIDEVLKIQYQDLVPTMVSGRGILTLRLPFRKTEQFGGEFHCKS